MRSQPCPASKTSRSHRVGRVGVSLLLALVSATPLTAASKPPPCLCLMPLRVPFEQDDPRSIGLEEKVVLRLEESGFAVRRSREVEPIQASVDADRPLFDPLTGELLRDRWAERQHALGRALVDSLGCDARIQVSIRNVMAINAGGSAVWDGQSIPIATSVFAVVNADQISHVAALSLWIELFDVAGESLSFRSAGIEPLIHLSLGRSVDQLPKDRWLSDDAVVVRAVDSALGQTAVDLRLHGGPIPDARDLPFSWPDTR